MTADEFAAATPKLRWVQSSSAGVEWMWAVPGLADSDVQVTNMRGAHAATIAEHTFAMLLEPHPRPAGLRAAPARSRMGSARDRDWAASKA